MRAFLVAAAAAIASAQYLVGNPIAAANATSKFALLRAPEFTLRALPTRATLYLAARGSPRPPEGTTQAKLLGAAVVYVNGVLVGAGPGHNVPTNTQVVRALDVLPFLRAAGANALGIATFFDHTLARGSADTPRVDATLVVTDGGGDVVVTATNASWRGWGADAYFNPTGDAGVSWYPFPNEFLDARARPLAWAAPGFDASAWPPAKVAAPWPAPLYLEPGPAPQALVRTACAVAVVNASRQILDYGQEFMGGASPFTRVCSGGRSHVSRSGAALAGSVLSCVAGGSARRDDGDAHYWRLAARALRLFAFDADHTAAYPSLGSHVHSAGVNLSFVGAARGARVTVTLAEELATGGTHVLSPARTGNAWRSTWTLSGDAAMDAGLHHHE